MKKYIATTILGIGLSLTPNFAGLDRIVNDAHAEQTMSETNLNAVVLDYIETSKQENLLHQITGSQAKFEFKDSENSNVYFSIDPHNYSKEDIGKTTTNYNSAFLKKPFLNEEGDKCLKIQEHDYCDYENRILFGIDRNKIRLDPEIQIEIEEDSKKYSIKLKELPDFLENKNNYTPGSSFQTREGKAFEKGMNGLKGLSGLKELDGLKGLRGLRNLRLFETPKKE